MRRIPIELLYDQNGGRIFWLDIPLGSPAYKTTQPTDFSGMYRTPGPNLQEVPNVQLRPEQPQSFSFDTGASGGGPAPQQFGVIPQSAPQGTSQATMQGSPFNLGQYDDVGRQIAKAQQNIQAMTSGANLLAGGAARSAGPSVASSLGIPMPPPAAIPIGGAASAINALSTSGASAALIDEAASGALAAAGTGFPGVSPFAVWALPSIVKAVQPPARAGLKKLAKVVGIGRHGQAEPEEHGAANVAAIEQMVSSAPAAARLAGVRGAMPSAQELIDRTGGNPQQAEDELRRMGVPITQDDFFRLGIGGDGA